MIVHFIGAGPGAADLLTLRGANLLARSQTCLYAGSLIPAAILEHCPNGCEIINTAPMSLDEITDTIAAAINKGHEVARLQSGDLSLYSAMGEQLRRLDQLGIAYDVTPGVPAFAASAAVLAQELTLPALAQSVVLTRLSGRATQMAETENLSAFAATKSTLAIHLSIHALDKVVEKLQPHYGQDCPIAIVWRASWPDQRIVTSTLGAVVADVGDELDRTALILVGPVLRKAGFQESRLYADEYDRRYRPRGTNPRFPVGEK